MANVFDKLKGMFGGGKNETPEDDLLGLTKDDLAKWRGRIDRAIAAQKTHHTWWDTCLKEYAPHVGEDPTQWRLRVRSNRAFAIVERKGGDLFFRQPDVTVKQSPLLEELAMVNPQFAGLSSAHAAILNEKLGIDGVNVVNLMGQAIFDLELFGAGWTKIGYRAWTKPVVTTVPGEPIPQPDPLTGQMAMVPGPETMQTVDVPIKTECYWENVSPKCLIIPDDCRGTDFDKQASFLGRRFQMALTDARRTWGEKIPKEFKPSAPKEDMYFDHGIGASTKMTSTDNVTGVELWYKTALYSEDEIHPDHLTWLVLIDGIDVPMEHEPSPDQTFDEQGRLTPDSLVGFPLHSVMTRVLTDSAYVMSDVAVALPQTMEMDAFREIAQEQRRINLLKLAFNTDELTVDELKKAMNMQQGGAIGLPPKAFVSGRLPLRAFDIHPIPPDDWALDAKLDNDLAQTFGIDANAQGVESAGSQTATEAGISQANRNVRAGKESNTVAEDYMRGVTKFSTLIQRYLSVEDAAAIVGQQKAQLWDSWRHAIPTRLAFTMLPDSALRNDTPLQRKQFLDAMTYAANDPNTDRRYLWEKFWELQHLDPTRAMIPAEQVPQPKPEQPKPSMAFKGEDFSPLSAQSPVMVDLWQKITGVMIDPAAMQNALALGRLLTMLQPSPTEGDGKPDEPAPHGGKLTQMTSLDKHQTDKSGGMQNTGELLPGMGGPPGSPGVN